MADGQNSFELDTTRRMVDCFQAQKSLNGCKQSPEIWNRIYLIQTFIQLYSRPGNYNYEHEGDDHNLAVIQYAVIQIINLYLQ